MDNCANCEHAIFDETWGEYKCEVFERRVYILLDSSECPEYKKGQPKVSKAEEESC